MALHPLHPQSDSAPASTERPNQHGFTPAMRLLLQDQFMCSHYAFAKLPQHHFESASAILYVMASGHQAREEAELSVGESEFDRLAPAITARALEGVASLIHLGILMQRVAEPE